MEKGAVEFKAPANRLIRNATPVVTFQNHDRGLSP
jgi:hypothetical protein